MASPIVLGLSLLGAGLAGRVGYQMLRAAQNGDKFLKGGFQAKMNKAEAMQILGLRCVAALLVYSTCVPLEDWRKAPETSRAEIAMLVIIQRHRCIPAQTAKGQKAERTLIDMYRVDNG